MVAKGMQFPCRGTGGTVSTNLDVIGGLSDKETKMRNMFLVGVVAICLSSCGTSNTAMTTQRLTSIISGNTVYGVNSSGRNFIQIFSYDGSLLSGSADSRDGSGIWIPEESGHWKVVDGSLCNTYTKPIARDAGCDKFHRSEGGPYLYTTPSGRQGSFVKIVGGRAE